jgi:KaiC/GvpD/RAD55 family RecA-like ATPase
MTLSAEDRAQIAAAQRIANDRAIELHVRETPQLTDNLRRIGLGISKSKFGQKLIVPAQDTEPHILLRHADQIEPRDLDPLWDGVLWFGKTTLVAGDPGLSKSLLTTDIAARVSCGGLWPCSNVSSEPGGVLMLSAEDDPEDTIVPRLIAAGADRSRISFIDGVREIGDDGKTRDREVALDVHIDALRDAISKHSNTRLLVVDPISAFLGRADSHNNAETRTLLASLGRLATETRIAVLVVSHMNKASGSSALYRVTGSLAFVAAPRAVFAVTRDPADANRRLLLPVKCNLGPDAHGYGYCIRVADNGAPYIEWGTERITNTVEEVLSAKPSPRKQSGIDREAAAQAWLRNQLAPEPQLATAMWAASAAAGYSRRDVERAQKALRVIAEIKGLRGPWYWSLPSAEET